MSDGSITVVISPINAVNGNSPINASVLPFFRIAAVDGNPYTTATNTVGPFNSQLANMMNYAIDYLKVSFINT